MTPERWKRLEQIFHAAREAAPANRAAHLAAACGDDESLRREVEHLLADADALSQLESRTRSVTAPTSLPAGTKVGPYVIEEHLDAGGMGVVYRASDARLDRQVAIKVGLAQFSDRFLREARAVARLNHVNVCTLHDIGSTPDIPGYLVMEFVDGSTLARRLESGPMPIAEAVDIATQIAAGLAAAHEQGIVHRDLKPANIKITPQDVVKILDFGLAKDFPSQTLTRTDEAPTRVATVAAGTLTVAGTVVGTAAYMSPEQAEGRSADARSDVFSFGIVLYEMLCGRRPFTGPTPTEIRAAIVGANFELPRNVRAEIPEQLQEILSRCLQRLPGARYASGAALHDDLEKLIETLRPARFWSRRTLVAAAVLVMSIATYSGWQTYRRHADARWVEATAVPRITTLLQENRALEALALYRRAERLTPNSKLLYKLAEGAVSSPVRFETTPPGAKIYISDYTAGLGDDVSRWQFVGTTPVTLPELPDWGYYRLRAVKEGFAPVDRVFMGNRSNPDDFIVTLTLHESGTVPTGMVWVPAGSHVEQVMPAKSIPGFWIDRFEVTNRQFREFVSAGGYQKEEYWKEPFEKGGRPIPREQAMSEFHDLTGRPGPRNWSLGMYAEGHADLPVAGVSWYEAMAYAEFAGKSLPTLYEWRRVAPLEEKADVALMSNFSGKGLAPVGAHRAPTTFGAYDMAGNVKEWTANAVGTLRYAMGGAWDDSVGRFGTLDASDPFLRTVSMGFRTVRRPTPVPPEDLGPLDFVASGLARTEEPVDDQTYQFFAGRLRYDPSPLDPNVDRTDKAPPFWIRETVSFKAAYGNDRMIAHLFLPKNVAPPYQVVIVFGGFGIHRSRRVEDFGFPFEFLIRSGRAVMIPAFWGTLERGPSEFFLPPNQETDRSINWSRDLGRSIDYLQTRPEIFDLTKLGYYGISWGATHAPRLLAVETRVKAAVMLSGSLNPLRRVPREVDPWNFAPRDLVPTLMVNGREDFVYPYETNTKLLFEALGAPAAEKKLVLLEGGHTNPVARPDLLGEVIGWFDRYFGPVQERDE